MAELDLRQIPTSDRPPEEQAQQAKEYVSRVFTQMEQFACVCSAVVREWNNLTADENPNQAEIDPSLKSMLSLLAQAFYETSDKDSAFIRQSDEESGEWRFSLADAAETELVALIDEFHGERIVSGETDKDIATRLAEELIKKRSELAVPRITNRIADVSLKPFDYALTMIPNPNAFIAPLGTSVFDRFKIDPQTNQVVQIADGKPLATIDSARIMRDAAKKALYSEYDFSFVGYVLEYIFNNPHMVHGDTFEISFQHISDPLLIDITHAERFAELLSSLEPYYGIVFVDGVFQGVFAVLKVVKRDDVKKTLTFAAPYLIKIRDLLTEKKQSRNIDHKKKIKISSDGLNRLVRSEIHKEQNQTAIAIVFRIVALLLQNPNKKRLKNQRWEKYVVSHICFKTIGENTDLQKRLDAIKDNRQKTRVIRAAFDKAFELMRRYSDAFEYFSSLEIYTMNPSGGKHFLDIESLGKAKPKGAYTGISPTFAEYNAGTVLYFRHKGINPNWAHEQD